MEYIQRNVCKEEYTSRKQGNWGQIEGDTMHFFVSLTQSYQDLGIYSVNALEWVAGKTYYKGDFVTYEKHTFQLLDDEFAGYYDEEYEELWFDEPDEEGNLFDEEGKFIGKHWIETSSIEYTEVIQDSGIEFTKQDVMYDGELSAITSSKLTSLRRSKKPTNDDGTEMLPSKDSDEDWQILYLPELVVNIHGKTEQYIEDGKRKARTVDATGDMVKSIEKDEENHIITFTYVIGIELEDETLEPIDGTGVQYVETYYYDEEEYKFDDDYENVTMDNLGKFKTTYSKVYEDRRVGGKDLSISSISSDITFKDETVGSYANIFKKEYLLGTTYPPKVEANIIVDRGINSCFEKHIALGEVKNLQALLDYRNGGFYSIRNDEENPN